MSRSCFILISLIGILSFACQDNLPIPKPRAYPKVEYPEKAYQDYQSEACPFAFSYPSYTNIEKKAEPRYAEDNEHPCWFDVHYPQYDGRIYFSYHPLEADTSLDHYRRQTFEMVDWHNKRANYIDEVIINRPGVKGLAFDIQGPAASPFQFFVTDEENHFLRGALYFNTQARPDSLAPVTDFVMEDVLKIIETIEWTN